MPTSKRSETETSTAMAAQDLHQLETSVKVAGTSLTSVANKLSEVETILGDVNPDADGEVDDIAVMTLLESMSEVQTEYQNLRKDIKEVQQLQKEMTNSLICQRQKMVQTFRILKKKIEMRSIQN